MNNNAKYELTGETKEVDGVTVHQIRALRTILLRADVGDLGGWVEGEKNLSHDDDCWIGVNAVVMEQARVQCDARVTGDALVRGNAVVNRKAHVTGSAIVSGYSYVTDEAHVSGQARIFENAQLCDLTTVLDTAQMHGSAAAYGRTRVEGNAVVAGRAELRDAHLDYDAAVQNQGQVIVLSGLTDDLVTVYRAPGQPGGHRVTVGCQTFTLNDDLEELAIRHGYRLTPAWEAVRAALLGVVGTW